MARGPSGSGSRPCATLPSTFHARAGAVLPVTGPATGGTERDTRAPSRPTGTQGAVGALLVVLALGLALRLILAFLFPGSGFGVDLSAFQFWAADLAAHGPHGFYDRDFFHDYTPGYLYVLWLIGIIGQAIGGVGVGLIKIPAIIADLVIGWLVWSMLLELGARRSLALGAAFVAVVNPVSWFDSVVWGQVDSVGVVFLLLGLRDLWRDRPERSAIFAVIAALIKPQLGILIPLVVVVTIRRALWPIREENEDDEQASAGSDTGILARLRAWERRTDHPIRIVTTGLVAIATTVVLCLPFGLSVLEISSTAPFFKSGLLSQVFATASGYPYLTVNAFNPWALVAGDTGNSLANSGLWVVRRSVGSRRLRVRRGDLRTDPGRARRQRGDAGRRGDRGARRGTPAGPPDAAAGADRPRDRVLRGPDPGPRALRLPGVRAGRHARRDRLALAHRLRGVLAHGPAQHVRGADEPVLQQSRDLRLARDQPGAQDRAAHLGDRDRQRRGLPVGVRADAPARARPPGRRARGRGGVRGDRRCGRGVGARRRDRAGAASVGCPGDRTHGRARSGGGCASGSVVAPRPPPRLRSPRCRAGPPGRRSTSSAWSAG